MPEASVSRFANLRARLTSWRALPSRSLAWRVGWWVAVVALLGVTAATLPAKASWYLAVDQFGYLTFARDLRAGRVFHDWPPGQVLASLLPEQADVLAQTYVRDGDRLFCRYAPGYPLALAAWTTLFGEDAAHRLNPWLYVALLGALLQFYSRALGSRWRALTAVGVVLFAPTYLEYWGKTIARDLVCHLSAILGLTLLWPHGARRLTPARMLSAGLLLGFAASTRPDAVIYVLAAGPLVLLRWQRQRADRAQASRAIVAAAVGGLFGLAPSLGYYWIATGNPFRPTQSMEIEHFFESVSRLDWLAPAAAIAAPAQGDRPWQPFRRPTDKGWQTGRDQPVQGGGLRLDSIPYTLPGNLRLLMRGYGATLLGAAVVGAVLSWWLRPYLFATTVPYLVFALLFYSCWGRPDPRYLVSVHLLLPPLIVEGLFGATDLIRRAAIRVRKRVDAPRDAARARAVGIAIAALLAIGIVAQQGSAPRGQVTTTTWLVAGAALVATIGAIALPRRRVTGIVVPTLALLLTYLAIAAARAPGQDAAFGAADARNARASLAKLVPPHSVILTNENLGRPAENIEYYLPGRHALYGNDLERWRVNGLEAVRTFLAAGWSVYVLTRLDDPSLAGFVSEVGQKYFQVEKIADLPPPRSYDVFVAAPFHAGLHLGLFRLKPLPVTGS